MENVREGTRKTNLNRLIPTFLGENIYFALKNT